MGKLPAPTSAQRNYALAYAIHYTERDPLSAMHSYERILASHPGTVEARYAESQLRNIAVATVSAEDLTAAWVKLASDKLESTGPSTAP